MMQRGDNLSFTEHDAALEARLAHFDATYGQALVSLLGHDELLRRVQHMHARRRFLDRIVQASTTLPSSIVRRFALLATLKPKRVLFCNDTDGLAVLAAERYDTQVRGDTHPYRAWLEHEVKQAGVKVRMDDACDAASFDVVHLRVAALSSACEQIEEAVKYAKPRGHLMISVSASWTPTLQMALEQSGYSVTRYLSVDRTVLANRWVLGTPNDILVAEKRTTLAPLALNVDWACPYAWHQIDGLAAEKLEVAQVDAFFTLLESATEAPAFGKLAKNNDLLQLICWTDTEGRTVEVRINREERYALVHFMPYDVNLEQATLWALLEAFGSSASRIRQNRPSFAPTAAWGQN